MVKIKGQGARTNKHCDSLYDQNRKNSMVVLRRYNLNSVVLRGLSVFDHPCTIICVFCYLLGVSIDSVNLWAIEHTLCVRAGVKITVACIGRVLRFRMNVREINTRMVTWAVGWVLYVA